MGGRKKAGGDQRATGTRQRHRKGRKKADRSQNRGGRKPKNDRVMRRTREYKRGTGGDDRRAAKRLAGTLFDYIVI
jgi:hypothetical protein